ncbi:MAG: AEC family transporter [Bacillota bacterium]|nr:AEC family transporter [Bacillota bacterium]
MELTIVAAKAVLKIFIMVALGFVAAKAKILTKEVSDGAAKILINICCPVLAMTSFFREYDPSLVKGLLLSVLFGLLYYAAGIGLGYVFVKKDNPNKEVERIAIMYQNIGFIGLPIAQMILGADGVIYTAVHLALFQFVFFSHGILVFSGKVDKKSLLKTFKSPCILCALAGLIIFLFRIPVPEILSASLNSVGSCATPLGMMIAGGIIARSDMKAVMKNARTYLICALKLLALPLIIIALGKIFSVPEAVAISAIISAGCPQASFDVIYAEMYGKNSAYASGIFSLGTLVCMITIPLLVAFYGVI